MIHNLIEKRAIKTFKANDFLYEYGFFVGLLLLIKLATIGFSAYASFYLIKSFLMAHNNTETMAIVFTVLAIAFIEIPANVGLGKFYKLSIKGNIRWAIYFLLMSFIFFGISFFTTSNGFAQKEVQKTDNTDSILEKYDFQVSQLKKTAEKDKNQCDTAIHRIEINPAGWSGGIRCILLPNQLTKIDGYNLEKKIINEVLRADINIIEAKKAEELKVNASNLVVVENRFYYISASIMLVQLIVNGLIMFFFSKIYADKHSEQLARDTLKTFAHNIAETTDQLIKENISKQYISYMSALSFQLGEFDNKQTLPIVPKDNKSIGFKKTDDDPLNNARVGTHGTDEKTHGTHDVTNEIRSCKLCGTPFKPYNIKHVFCCTEHKLKWHKQNTGFDLDKFIKH